MRKLFSFLLCLLIGIGMATAQMTKISGVVVSAEDGQPIIGASVVAKGTTTGTITGLDGRFELNVEPTVKEVMVSYVGMKTMLLPAKAGMRIVMQSDSEELQEVIVTAMGISRNKKGLGYSTQEIDMSEVSAAANTTLSSAIQGKVSGVEVKQSSGMPGASSQITIRGARSFTGNNTPLYIVDGTPISSTADVSTGSSVTGADFASRSLDLDPNDIESINVLKGQAASALYGMRASNGVILITTKSGKGIAAGKPQISFGSNLSFDVLSTTPDFQMEFAQGAGGKYSPNSSMSWGPLISDLPNDPKYGGNTQNAYTDKYGMKEGQYFVPQRLSAGLDPWATPRAYDNTDDFFRTGTTWSNYANVAQAFEKGNYSFSIGNTINEGIVPNTSLSRYNVKMGGEAKLYENWTTGFVGNFVTSKLMKQTSANNGIVATVFGAPPSYDLAGIPSHIDGDPYTQNNYRGGSFDNAYWAVENNQFIERSQRFFGNAFLKYTTKFDTDNHKLDVKYQLGNDAYTTNYTDVWGFGHSSSKGNIDEWHYTINEMNSLLTASYNWVINDELIFDAVLGNEWIEYKRKFVEAYGANFNFPGWNHMNNASVYSGSSAYRKERTVGVFGSLSLAYKSMLFLNATGRNDIVSTMPHNNRSFFYPSVSLGWVFTELEPLRNDVLTFGKLRASYSEVGQAGTFYQSYYTVPSYGGGFSSGTPILYPINTVNGYIQASTVYDPNLKPQNTVSYEFGTDLTFYQGLVTLGYTYSRQNVKDQIFEVPLAGSTGISSLMMNGGKIHTNSHEVNLTVMPIRNQHVNWSIGFNFTKLDNYVDELAPGVNSIFLGGFVEPQVRAGIGDKFPVIYGTSYLRNTEGQIVVDKNGLPQMGEEMVIGSVSPDFRLGLNTTLKLWDLTISAVLDWKQGGQMYSGTSSLLDYYGTSQRSADFRKKSSFMFELDAVKKIGLDADQNPIYAPNDIEISGSNAAAYFSAMNNISESMVFDNSFIKLREISAIYPVYKKNSLAVNLSVFARNVILWSELKGLDPEASQGNNNMAGAFERFSLPGSASYGFGINVNF